MPQVMMSICQLWAQLTARVPPATVYTMARDPTMARLTRMSQPSSTESTRAGA